MATVTGISKDPISITGTDNKIDSTAELQGLADALSISAADLYKLFGGLTLSGENISLKELVEKIEEEKVPQNSEEAIGKAEALDKLIAKLNKAISKAKEELNTEKVKTSSDTTTIKNLEKKIEELEEAKTKAEAEIKAYLSTLNGKGEVLNGSGKNTLNSLLNKYGITTEKPATDSKSDSAFSNDPFKAMTSGDSSGTSAGKGVDDYGYGTGKFQPIGGDPAGYKSGGWTFNPMAWNMASINDQFTLDAWDMIGEQKKRQQMMMLFFYYARMAMSGDIGAMYQFMRFITYMIGRDKAMQNVWMGTKLIELQETSRKATQKLLETDVGEDLDSQTAWQKELQTIKSEEGIIATSQKLIIQMMEEFTQIVETLTNVQKSLLDSQGKVLSNLSVWR